MSELTNIWITAMVITVFVIIYSTIAGYDVPFPVSLILLGVIENNLILRRLYPLYGKS